MRGLTDGGRPRLGGQGVYIYRSLCIWLEALSPGAVAVVVIGAMTPKAWWGALAGGVVGTGSRVDGAGSRVDGAGSRYHGGTGLLISTIVTALVMSAWGWPVALALMANWFSWGGGRGARGAATVLWALLGWTVWMSRLEMGGQGHWEVLALAGVGLAANLVAIIFVLLRRRRMRRLSVFVVLLLLALPGAARADKVPVQGSAAGPQPGDVIFYEGFEEYKDFDQRVAAGWLTWSTPGSAVPEYRQANPDVGALVERPFSNRKHDGNNAQQYFTVFEVHDAGLYRVIQAPPGAVVEVSAWAEVWSSGEDDPMHSDSAQNTHVRIGLDPGGGIGPGASTVLWGAEVNPLSAWQRVPSVRAQVGEAGTLTVFLRSNPMYALKHNDVYWDDVQVTLVEKGKAAAAPAVSSGSAPASESSSDPILSGLAATGQKAANSGGWDTLLTGLLVTSVVGWSWWRRRR